MSANIPVEPALAERPNDYVVAVDVTASLWNKEDLGNPVRLVDQIVSIGISKQKSIEKRLANIVISPDLGDYRNTDFTKIDSLIGLGYAAARNAAPRIKSDLARQSLKTSPNPIATRQFILRLIGSILTRGFPCRSILFSAVMPNAMRKFRCLSFV